MGSADEELRARAEARIGRVLHGKYRLDRVLGIGGMGTVYAGTHRNRNRVAVKVLHPELAVDASLRSRFVREGYVANTVDHAGAVRVLDDDVAEDGAVFLVMELLEGETLDARWERCGRKLAPKEVASLIRDLLGVLDAAHAKGIVHRDIKPENVFLTREGNVKVLDFGVARLREVPATATRSGNLFGTPAFMPPEQALGRAGDVDALSDVWAVGATAFTLLSGRLVHEGATVEEVLVRAATTAAPPLRDCAPQVPARMAAVVDRALAFEKKERWLSAKAMQSEMACVVAETLWSVLADDEEGEGDWTDETTVAPPPEMTLHAGNQERKEYLGLPAETAPLPTLPLSTMAGMSANSVARLIRKRYALAVLLGLVLGTGIVITLLVVRAGAQTDSRGVAITGIASSVAPAAPPAPTPSAGAVSADAGTLVVSFDSLPRVGTPVAASAPRVALERPDASAGAP